MDWLVFVVLAGFGLGILIGQQKPRTRGTWCVAVAAVLLGLASAWGWKGRQTRLFENQQFVQTDLPHAGRPGGYVTSDHCLACHPNQYQSWHQTFHRTMTQLAQPDTVRGQFDQVSLTFQGKRYQLSKRGDEFWVELEDPESPAGVPGLRVWRRVGMLTGSHHMQVYWVPRKPGNLQAIFPFAYLFDDRRWVPLKDSFLRDPNLPQNDNLWNVDCLQCHTTAGQPRAQPAALQVGTRLGEMGIACESCHGPAEEHVRANRSPLRRYLLHQRAKGDATIVNPARLPPKVSSQICGQCHGIKWIKNRTDFYEHGFRYEPGQELGQDTPIIQPTHLAEQPWLTEPLRQRPGYLAERFWPDGMVRVSGRDYNGLIEAPCYQRGDLSCLSCHSMHQSEPVNQLRDGMQANQACLQCHARFQTNLAAHTHHDVNSSGSLCYNCHMPYTTYGLLKAIRSHYIESPSAATSARVGRPNGCNLCHLDRSLGWTDQHLAAWYGTKPASLSAEQQTVSAAVLWALKGDAGQRALIAWHLGWEPARQASGEQWSAPFLGQLLVDPYSAVRYIAGRSLERLPGFHDFKFDYVGAPADREQARLRALAQWRNAGKPDRSGPEVLINQDGELQQTVMSSLLQQRDDHSMELQE
jgi:predicted CXXCH cytochrome family protein